MTEETNVMVGENEVSLLDIAGIDLNEIAEYRLTVMPAGKYMFRIMESKLEARDARVKDGAPDEKVKKPAITFECEVQNCFALTDDKLDPATQIGMKYFETFWINDANKDLGRVKAFLVDIGSPGAGSLTDLLAEAQGVEFVCDITNTPDKNNPDTIWANLKKPMTVNAFAESQAA